MSGKFYVIRMPNGQYFRQMSPIGRKYFCDSFSDAAKLFDCEIENIDEVNVLANGIGGTVEEYSYESIQETGFTEVLKLNLM